ncbi:hypothetical protein ACIBH1_47800 [Nonomuraea sp. NPDC050663]|uniref:hypothetical protein n=1 Tax=Nonomuraea sp. NPDC050663 TaxID=3364370 RepID=UPI0037ABF568
MKRILLILGLLLPALVVATPARAGGWAVTYLDPVPAAFQPGTSYTIGSWLLQHGNHPYHGNEKDLKVGLSFSDGKRTLAFDAVRLREPAHYATAVALPAGNWRVTAIQEWFAPHELGTLKVPGAFTALPQTAEAKSSAADWLNGNGGKDPWGEIRPPGIGKTATAPVAAAAVPIAPASASVAAVASPWWRSPYTALAVVLACATLGLLAVRRSRRQNL